MQLTAAALLACSAALASGRAIGTRQVPDQQQQPFALYISQSANPTLANKYLGPAHIGAAQDLAAIVDQPMEVFYLQNGQLYYNLQTADGQQFQSAAGFSTHLRPGQHLQPLYMTPAGNSGVAPPSNGNGTNGGIVTDSSFLIDNQAHLTVRGSGSKWYACSDTQGAPGTGETMNALNLLVDGDQPMDSNCAQVTVDVVTVQQDPNTPPPAAQRI